MRFLLQPKWFRLQLISIMLISLNGLVTARSAVSSNNPIIEAVEPVLIVPSVTIAITTGVQTTCAGMTVTFTATPTNGGAGPTYQWQKGGTNISGATNATYTSTTLANGDAITCVMTSNAAGASPTTATSNSIAMTVTQYPAGTITNGATASFCGTGTLTAAPSGAAYQWKLNGADLPSATSSTYNATAPGNYTVAITVQPGSCSMITSATTVTVNPSPTVSITGVTSICAGATTAVSPTTGGTWASSNTGLATVTNAGVVTGVAAGAPTFAFTNTTTGCTATTAAVTVNALPTSTISNGATATFCGSGTLTAAAVTGATYQWKNSGTNIPTETAATYSATATGSYTVATIITATGCNTTSTATAVTVNPLPIATNTPASVTTFCQGGSVVLNATASTGVTYQWQKDGTNIPTATTTSYTANTTGAYRIVVTNTTTMCANPSPVTAVTVNAFPTATITPASSSTFCIGGSVVLNANTGTGLAYQWKESGNDLLNATNASYTTSTAGSYTVVVTNVSSCATTSTANPVIVNALPTATAAPAGVTTFCQGGNVVLNANTGAGLTYQWKNNGSNISGQTAASYTANSTGSYTVVVTNTTTTCMNTSAANAVTVNALPTATNTAAGATTFCQGGSVILNANTGAGLTYQWSKDGSPVMNATYSSFSANATGSYSVVVTDANSCMNTSTNTVTVNPLPTATSTAAGVTTFCQGGNVVLNANTGTGLVYQWKKNGTTIPSATNTSYTANTSGSYTVLVTDANRCMNTSAANVLTVNSLPNANISYVTPTAFCQGGNVVLSVPNNPNALYEWSRNGVTIPNATMAAYAATTSGNYKVDIVDANLCFAASAVTAVTVTANPSPVISINGNTNFCEGDSVQLTASGGLSYLWSTASTNPSIWVRAGGFYSVVVANGNCSATAAQQVSPRSVPAASIAAIGPLTFCRGNNVTLNANTGTGLTYQWQKNGNLVLGSTNSTFVADTTGNYRVIVTGSNGCMTASSVMAVTANANPIARLTPSTPIAFCQGDSAKMSISGGATYLWSNNKMDTAIWVKTGGAYAVTVTDANGCTAYVANSVTVNALPMATITAGGVTSVCPDDVVSLNAPVGTGYMYQWRRNGNAIGTNRVFNATTAGAYTVSVTDANGCKANSDTTRVTYFSKPTVSFTNSLQAGTGSVMNFTNTSSAGTVRWYFGDALNSTSTQANPTFTYRANGTYSVRLVVTNANGCSDSTSASVMVTGVRTGVNDLVEPLRINVFPNPFAETMQIEIENATVPFGNNDKIMVTNALGQIVHQAVLNQKVLSLDTQNWSEGMYQVMLYTNGQMIPVQKVVKVIR